MFHLFYYPTHSKTKPGIKCNIFKRVKDLDLTSWVLNLMATVYNMLWGGILFCFVLNICRRTYRCNKRCKDFSEFPVLPKQNFSHFLRDGLIARQVAYNTIDGIYLLLAWFLCICPTVKANHLLKKKGYSYICMNCLADKEVQS